MKTMRIAILGANSHIAKGLINNFLRKDDAELILYTRNEQDICSFISSVGQGKSELFAIKNSYGNFLAHSYDIIINCVGAGAPNKLKNKYSNWFTLTERFDNLCIEYLRKNPQTLYINFSSGAVYGDIATAPAAEDTCNKIKVNQLSVPDYYAIANLNAEAKHRAFSNLNIVDLRIFSYFSRFIDLSCGYFITELINAVITKKLFITNELNIIRDYIDPDDLFSFIMQCAKQEELNGAFDMISAKSVEKFEIIDFFAAEYSLKYKVEKSFASSSPNGIKNIYCSNYHNPLIKYKSRHSSLETIKNEAKALLDKKL